jgi:ribosomal protein L37AE/L43A
MNYCGRWVREHHANVDAVYEPALENPESFICKLATLQEVWFHLSDMEQLGIRWRLSDRELSEFAKSEGVNKETLRKAAYRAEEMIREETHIERSVEQLYRGKQKSKICPICKREFRFSRRGNQTYCSKKCREEQRLEKRKTARRLSNGMGRKDNL